MSPDFKFNLDGITEDGSPDSVASKAVNNYYQAGNIRNICFKWQSGRCLFLNYSYLVSGEFQPQDNSILLEFTTQEVLLKGVLLDALYKEILQQLTQYVICQDQRYNEIENDAKPIVNEIMVQKNK